MSKTQVTFAHLVEVGLRNVRTERFLTVWLQLEVGDDEGRWNAIVALHVTDPAFARRMARELGGDLAAFGWTEP